MKQYLETSKTVGETIKDLRSLFSRMGVTEWYPVPDSDSAGYSVRFQLNGKWIPVHSGMQPTREGNCRMCYRAVRSFWEMQVRGITGMVAQMVRESGLVISNNHNNDSDVSYAILGLTPTATKKEVESAYRSKAMKAHPDHGGDADYFKAVQAAYESLGKG